MMFGYAEIGSASMPPRPAITMNAEMTQAKIGRVMKNLDNMWAPYAQLSLCAALGGRRRSSWLPCLFRGGVRGHRTHLNAGLHLEHALDDVTIAGREALG